MGCNPLVTTNSPRYNFRDGRAASKKVVTAWSSASAACAVKENVAELFEASAWAEALESSRDDLRLSEENLAKIFNVSPGILCILRLEDRAYVEINKAYEEVTGYSRGEVIGKTGVELGLWVRLEDRERAFQEIIAKGSVRQYRGDFMSKAGAPITALLSAEVLVFGGERCVLVAAEDVTERILAEEARLSFARGLMNAQEAERTRIARELHDNIGQSIALFSVQLERVRQLSKQHSTQVDDKLQDLCGKIKELGHEVSGLSHQLHSSELEYFGLHVAAKSLCREFAAQYPIKVNCKCDCVPQGLGADIAISLLRVMQEALHNIAKHSRAKNIEVGLRGTESQLCLSIVDDGIGFASEQMKLGSGIGLISMRERVHLVGGDFNLWSRPGQGTRIEACVPVLKPEAVAVAADESDDN